MLNTKKVRVIGFKFHLVYCLIFQTCILFFVLHTECNLISSHFMLCSSGFFFRICSVFIFSLFLIQFSLCLFLFLRKANFQQNRKAICFLHRSNDGLFCFVCIETKFSEYETHISINIIDCHLPIRLSKPGRNKQ